MKNRFLAPLALITCAFLLSSSQSEIAPPTGTTAQGAALVTTPPPTPGAALFFYPPPYLYNDHHPLDSIQAVSVSQVTDLVPAVSFMSGIALVVDWSSICPTAGACDFTLIDRTLAYWMARNKKIVLSVATISFPFMSAPDGKNVQNATPDWVLAQVKTYPVATEIMGEDHGDESDGRNSGVPISGFSGPEVPAAYVGTRS